MSQIVSFAARARVEGEPQPLDLPSLAKMKIRLDRARCGTSSASSDPPWCRVETKALDVLIAQRRMDRFPDAWGRHAADRRSEATKTVNRPPPEYCRIDCHEAFLLRVPGSHTNCVWWRRTAQMSRTAAVNRHGANSGQVCEGLSRQPALMEIPHRAHRHHGAAATAFLPSCLWPGTSPRQPRRRHRLFRLPCRGSPATGGSATLLIVNGCSTARRILSDRFRCCGCRRGTTKFVASHAGDEVGVTCGTPDSTCRFRRIASPTA